MELQTIDRRVRHLLKQHRGLHPCADVDRLYLPRSYGGRGLLSAEDIIKKESCALYDYVRNSDKVMCAVANSGILFSDESAEQFSSRKVVERLNSYKSKPLHGHFFTVCNPIMDNDISFHWLKSGDLHAETEGMLVAAQDQALPTRFIQHLYDERCSYFEESKVKLLSTLSVGVSFWLPLSIRQDMIQ